jgi:CzcA family heavy metal efflux pump
MLRRIIGLSLQFRFLLAFLVTALIVTGAVRLRDAPVDLLPEFSPPQVEVQTEALGLAAAEVEALITVPLEEMVGGVPWLRSMHSRSINGLSSILLTFEPGTDVMDARQMVQERLLHTSALPRVSKRPAMLQPVSSTNRAMIIGLTSGELSLIDLSILARWNIKPRLLGVPGVANVAIWGQRERQLQVQVDPVRLKDSGVLLSDVIRASGDALWSSPLSFLQASTPGNGGFIDTPNQRLDIRHVLPISSPDDLAKVTFQTAAGANIRLGDVAEVVEGHPPLIGDGVVKGGPGLLLVIEKFPWANTPDVTAGVEAALAALRPGLPGVEIDQAVFRPATFIELAIGNLAKVLVIGGVLVTLVLVTFLRHGRGALVGMVAIPLSLVTALLVLNVLGVTINTMIVAGLAVALGAVIDDAIVDVENILRRLRENHAAGRPQPAARMILAAALETRGPLVYATAIVLLAAAPVLLMAGLSGGLYRPLAIAYGLALLASMAVALTVTPALGLILLAHAPPPNRVEPPLVRRLQEAYEGILTRILAAPRAKFAATGALLLVGLTVLPLLNQSLLPAFKERDLLLRWVSPPGISYPEMSRLASEAALELRSVPGVRNAGAELGRAVASDVTADINSAAIWVSIDPGADYDATVAAVRTAAAEHPGLGPDVLSFATTKLGETLAALGDTVIVRIFGPDLAVLRGEAEEVRQTLAGIAGVVAPQIETFAQEEAIEIEVNLAAAERHGLKPGDVRRAATTLVAGIEVGSLFEEQKVFEVVVWGAPETRSDLAGIRELLIDTPAGGHVRLGDVADVRFAANPTGYARENASRRIAVSAGVSGRDLDAVVDDIEDRLQEIQFPLEYHAEPLDADDDAAEARERFLSVAVAAAIASFLLLQACFRSWRLAAMTFVAVPAALTGGVLAAAMGGGVLTLGSLAGLLAVLGIAVRNAVLLVGYYQRLERQEGMAFGPRLLLRGAEERFQPILATALAVALGVLPMIALGDVPGLEILRPMAVAVLGGLVTSTVLSLLLVPALYAVFRVRPEAGEENDEEEKAMRHAAV